MKLFCFIVILFMASCNSIKIQEIESMGSTQRLVGKVKQISTKSIHYPIHKTDSTSTETSSVLFFDEQNKVIKQIDKYNKFTDETVFIYKNGLLESTLTKSMHGIMKTQYKYDDRKNVIENKQWENDTLYFRKTSIYDSRNNPIEQTYYHPTSENLNSVEKFTYDYKKRTIIIDGEDENKIPRNTYLKQFFNRKGIIIRSEFIYKDVNKAYSTYTKIEYDKLGNVSKRTQFNNDGVIKAVSTYKNFYDKKGNVIKREKYLNDKMIEKTINEISYL